MIIKKSPAEIDQMAAAGDILVRTMDLLAGKIRAGVTTQDLDAAAEKFIRSQGRPPPSRATAASRARSAPRPTTWSFTASQAASSSPAATFFRSTSVS